MNTSIYRAKNLLVIGLASVMLSFALQSCQKHNDVDPNPPENGDCYETVDLGLSVLWGSCNVGASTPEGKGNWYSWEDVQKIEKKGMRLPTEEEFQELLNSDKVTWEKVNPRNWAELDGYRVTNKTTKKSIFLPVNGYKALNKGDVSYPNNMGFYWSSTESLTETTDEDGAAITVPNGCMCTLKLQYSGAEIHINTLTDGISVRFVKDLPKK